MTLDISQFIANSIRKESKIHHLDINVKAVAKDDVPSSVTKLIYKDYGDKYLEDANYIVFFWGGINKDNIDKLFNVADKALGKSANKLTDKDFKKINMGNDDSKSEDVENTEDVEDTEETEVDDIDVEDTEDIEDEETSEKDNEEADELDEDENEDIEVSIEEKPEIPTAYFFLKITSK